MELGLREKQSCPLCDALCVKMGCVNYLLHIITGDRVVYFHDSGILSDSVHHLSSSRSHQLFFSAIVDAPFFGFPNI